MSSSQSSKAHYLATKVPEITVYFWIIKILTTGMGETTSDFLVTHLNPVLGVALGFVGLVIALVLQFRLQEYNPWIYWLTAIMIAIFGTMAADAVHVGLGVPYLFSSLFFLVVLIVIFILWYVSEKTLSVHSITTRRRELFYWCTIMATFALGTATGDMTATTFHLGYLSSGILFAVLIAIVTLLHYIAKGVLSLEHRHQSRNAVLAFWLAYILTRPLGASFADWMGVSQARGGLGWGTGPVSLVLLIIIVLLIAYSAVTQSDVEKYQE